MNQLTNLRIFSHILIFMKFIGVLKIIYIINCNKKNKLNILMKMIIIYIKTRMK